MEPRRGGIVALLGAIILLLSVPLAISLSLGEINPKYGLSLTFEQMLALFRPLGLYVVVISIAFNIILGLLLALLSGIVILRKSNDTIAVLITTGGMVGSISSLLIGGIIGSIGAVLVMIGGGIASSTKSLAPQGALFVAEGNIDGKKVVDWIFCENKFVVAHIASITVATIVGFIVILLTLIFGVNLNINMYIGGAWLAVAGFTVALVFMTIQKNKSRRKLQGLSPDQILNAHPKNFALSYSDVTSIKAEQKILGTSVTLTWNGKKGVIEIRSNKLEFEQANDLLMKLFGDKISFM